MSDASSDRTDEIVRGFESRGVRLVRMPVAARERALPRIAPCHWSRAISSSTPTRRSASRVVRCDPLIKVFQDPTVGAASGRDVSVGDINAEANASEAGYVGYEMGVRALETRLGGIIGASGCFYAIRRDLVDTAFPEELSRDFASPLRARQLGYRTVSVDAALCIVPRARSLQAEYKRKIRTMLRGLNTLWFLRSLLNPLRYGRFAWMLASHKLARWLGFLALPLAPIGLATLAPTHPWAAVLVALGAAGVAAGLFALNSRDSETLPGVVKRAGFAVASALAGFIAWMKFFAGTNAATWEPTRRPDAASSGQLGKKTGASWPPLLVSIAAGRAAAILRVVPTSRPCETGSPVPSAA